MLYLSFPGAIIGQDILNQVRAVVEPYERPSYEPFIYLDDDVTVMPGPIKDLPPPGDIAHFDKSSLRPIFRDRLVDKEKLFPWELTFLVNKERMKEGYYFQNVRFNDYNLDERMAYVDVQLPFKSHVAQIIGYDQLGEEVERETSVNGVYKLKPENIYV